jgi:membrane-associated protein
MVNALTDWFLAHPAYAPWISFSLVILAGLNFPISIDLVMILSSFLAATIIPEKTFHIYIALFLGCYLSAMFSYWFGRILGEKMLKFSWFAKLLNPKRLVKIRSFYEKYGLWTLIFGRFIPCGVRNCMFMSSGMSRTHFGKFLLRDLIACFIWVTTCFYLFYTLGQNYHVIYERFKIANLIVFSALGVTGIVLLWYKFKKRKRAKMKAEIVEIDPSQISNEEVNKISNEER